jgi:arylsulfatase A-like enzyme
MPPYVYVENDLSTSLPSRVTKGNNAPAGDSLYDGLYWREGPTGEDFEHSDCTPLFFAKAGDFIKEKAALQEPYFLYLALPSPHTPIIPSPEFKGRSSINTYADFVIEIDDRTGKLLDIIEQTGELDNTIIIFASDNGSSPWADFETLRAAGHNPNYIFRGHKADLYEGGHHIPCLLQWPAKIKKHHVIEQTFCLNDFIATFASITGYTLSENEAVDSYDFLPALMKEGYNEVIREATVHHSVNGLFAIRKGRWKLLLSPGSGGWSYPRPGKEEKGLPTVQLFDIIEDPTEKNNLYQQHPEIVKELTDLLNKYISEGRSVKR